MDEFLAHGSLRRINIIMSYLAYKFRIYPTKQQERQFRKQLGCNRWVWNHMLGKNNERYKVEKKFIFYNDMSGMLPELKEDFEWLQESNSQTLQTILKS